MYILVCGGRDYYDYLTTSCVLYETRLKFGRFIVVQGGARGADSLARWWCEQNGFGCITVKAKWELHGRAAGPIRNQKMLDLYNIEYGISLPGGRGTADMVSRLHAASIPTRIVL